MRIVVLARLGRCPQNDGMRFKETLDAVCKLVVAFSTIIIALASLKH
jgi:hypothetical protein